MKRITGGIMIFLLLLSTIWAIAETDEIIALPSSLGVIEEEAFYGIVAEKVMVPEGTTEIHSRAFADCTLTEVVLPPSLKYIADDAFEGCPEELMVFAGEDIDTYAYEWADAKGYISGPIKKLVIELPNAVKSIDILEPYQIPFHTVPKNTTEKLQWKSLDPEIGTVDQHGVVTPLKPGYVNIMVSDSEGSYLGMASLEILGDFYQSEGLEYTLTEDGTGYRVIGYTGDPERITMPSVYKGLPVVGFEPGAFRNCTKLTDIALEDGHSVLYMENDALYANLPGKTLLCYPGKHIIDRYYYVPEGTQAIAAYAFSHCYLRDLTIPEGVISIGDCAFYKLQNQLAIYLPDSLTDFGEYLFQSQQMNAAFYTNSMMSPGFAYAQENNIPCAVIQQRTPEPTIAPTPTPAPTITPDIPAVDESGIVVYDQLYAVNCSACNLKCLYDISALEGDGVSEVRLAIQNQWESLIYYPEMAQQTGLYGAGYTGQKAILRAYDKYGNLVGAKEISGNFTFSFEGARILGVAGGKGTKMMVVPTKPIFITSPGRYPIQPSQWHDFLGGDIYQHYIVAMPRGMMYHDFPQHLNVLAYQQVYCTTNTWPYEVAEPKLDYMFCTYYSQDSSRLDQLNQITLVFDTMDCMLDNEELTVYAATLEKKSDNLGEKIHEVFSDIRQEMIGSHYPASSPVKKVSVYIDGSYPQSKAYCVWLNYQFCELDEYEIMTVAHEFVHAIDLCIWQRSVNHPIPSAWLEGRAEYISGAFYAEAEDFDWSFLSASDREDFFQYYYHSVNSNTTYSVGYYFYDFLIDTYGSNVGAKIMNNIATLSYDGSDGAEFFKQCVEAATEDGVFQRFVNDVVTPSGT